MITVDGYRGNGKNKEEKMKARRARCAIGVVCVLIVGLSLALDITALAEPPGVEYRPGVNAIYRGNTYNVAPKVSTPVYYFSNCKPPSFHPRWTIEPIARPKPWQPHPGLLSNMYLVPEVRVPQY